MSDARIGQLDGARAVAAVNTIVDQWLRHEGAVALRDVERVRVEAERQSVQLPTVLVVNKLDEVTPEQGDVARALLEGFSESENARVREWCGQALDKLSGDRVQMDPFTASLIVTGLFSGMVLISKLYTDRTGNLRLAKLNKGDVAAIAGIASAIFAALL